MNERFIPIRVFRCYNKIFLFLGHIYIYLALATNAGRKQRFKDMLVMKYVKDFCIFEKKKKIYRSLHTSTINLTCLEIVLVASKKFLDRSDQYYYSKI